LFALSYSCALTPNLVLTAFGCVGGCAHSRVPTIK
jgi:hypothetical protein